MSLQQIASSLLLHVKKEEDPSLFLAQLAAYPASLLFKELENDDAKKAFWINCYNAFFLYLRRDQGHQKPEIYRSKLIEIAGHRFSLDDLEHGILRRFRIKISLGYLPNIFASSIIKQLAVKAIDYRIHFALNCGAKSCPPIAFYSAEKISQQLEWASLGFLENETDYYPDQKEIHFTKLGLWFLGDFGGYKGIRQLITQKLNWETKDYKLIFKDYDWDEQLDNFAESSFDD